MSEKMGIKAECPSCGSEIDLLQSKSERVLFLCKKCGLQSFERGEECKAWFAQLVKNRGVKK